MADYVYNLTDNCMLGLTERLQIPRLIDCTELDAKAYPTTALTGFDGKRYLINPPLPAGSADWSDVTADGDTIRALTAAELAARQAQAEAAAQDAARAARSQEIAAYMERAYTLCERALGTRSPLTTTEKAPWSAYSTEINTIVKAINAGADPLTITLPAVPAGMVVSAL